MRLPDSARGTGAPQIRRNRRTCKCGLTPRLTYRRRQRWSLEAIIDFARHGERKARAAVSEAASLDPNDLKVPVTEILELIRFLDRNCGLSRRKTANVHFDSKEET